MLQITREGMLDQGGMRQQWQPQTLEISTMST
jgi:hypothetical protein